VVAREVGDRHPPAVALDEAERGTPGEQHVHRALGQPEPRRERGGGQRPVRGEPAEQVELGHRGDQEVRRVGAVAQPVERFRVRDGHQPAAAPGNR
jgi:hypothetical protein